MSIRSVSCTYEIRHQFCVCLRDGSSHLMSSKCQTQALQQDYTLSSSVSEISCRRKSHEIQFHRLPQVEKTTRSSLGLLRPNPSVSGLSAMVLDSSSLGSQLQRVHEATTAETLLNRGVE